MVTAQGEPGCESPGAGPQLTLVVAAEILCAHDGLAVAEAEKRCLEAVKGPPPDQSGGGPERPIVGDVAAPDPP